MFSVVKYHVEYTKNAKKLTFLKSQFSGKKVNFREKTFRFVFFDPKLGKEAKIFKIRLVTVFLIIAKRT